MFTQFTHYLRIIYAVYVGFVYACLYGLRMIRAHSCLRSLRIIYALFTQFTWTLFTHVYTVYARYLHIFFLRSLRRIYADFTQYLRSLRGHENIYACEKYLQSLRRIYADFTQVYAACVN